MRIILSALTLLLGSSFFNATISQQVWCGTDYNLQQLVDQNEVTLQEIEENWILSDGPMPATSESGRAVRIIPVVVHVVHDNGVGNISYEQVQSAIDMLNEDYRRLNSDTSSTRPEFKPYATDSEIEFRLALIDPDGNCTNGVVRINNPGESNDADNSVKSTSFWPSNKYLNIWTVNSIGGGGGGGIILGYAQFPGSGSWSTYGIVIRHDRMGRIGTAGFGDRTLSHEMGHCLNLLHTFQSGCGGNCSNSGDRVCDTPPVASSSFGCSSNQNTCSNDMSGNSPFTSDMKDQIENYMSYDDCQNMFTIGQKARMLNVLNNIPQLANLVSTSNLNATGVLQTSPGVCKADFEVSSQVVCMGEPVSFSDQSYFNPTSYSWEFEGGSPAVSSAKNPSITYTVSGKYKVKLTISDNSGSASTTKTDYITVLPQSEFLPAQESFEFTGTPEDNFWFAEMFSTGLGWVHHTTAGATGAKSMKVNGFAEGSGKVNLYSPAYNLANMSSATVSFKYAYAPRTNGGTAVFRAYISTDCGNTWSLKYANGNAGLATAPAKSGPYQNPGTGEWATASFSIGASQISANLRIRFEMNINDGNNFFLDDVNINGVFSEVPALVYPFNGSTGRAQFEVLDWLATSNASNYELELDTSLTFGSPVLQTASIVYNGIASNGTDTKYDASGLIQGATYFWRVRTISTTGTANAWSDVWSFTVSTTVGVGEVETYAFGAMLFPNPSERDVTLKLEMDESKSVNAVLFDIRGREIYNIYRGDLPAGTHNLNIEKAGLSKGVYFVRLTVGNQQKVMKLVFN